MNYFHLTNYIKQNYKIDPQILDNIKFLLDSHIHHFGNNFKSPIESSRKGFYHYFRLIIRRLYIVFKIIQNANVVKDKKRILSSSYFSVNSEIEKLQYQVFCPSWSMSGNRNVLSTISFFLYTELLSHHLNKYNFGQIISSEFANEIVLFKNKLKIFLIEKQIDAIIVPNDQTFFANVLIEVCKQVKIPSFIFLHGLPCRYNDIDENRADYLIVWGNKIKENYIKAGINSNKILVSGHPYYTFNAPENLKFSFENILIISKSIFWAQYSDKIRLSDRGNLILYLFSIEKILKEFGVRSVRFRPHPSENFEWYLKFINRDFFKLDYGPIKESILKSSLIIGPTSTVFLESIYYGINYLIYEPSVKNIDIMNYELISPFDGKDQRVPVAKNEIQLAKLLKDKQKVDSSFFSDYIQTPFNLDFLNALV